MFVYFIRCGFHGPLKIGVAANVEKRLSDLQVGNHVELRIIAKIPCKGRKDAYRIENKLHKRFKEQRISGEWFRSSIKISSIWEVSDIDKELIDVEMKEVGAIPHVKME